MRGARTAIVLVDRKHASPLPALPTTAERVVVVGPQDASSPAAQRGWEWVARPAGKDALHAVLRDISNVDLLVLTVRANRSRQIRLVARLAPYVATGGHIFVVVPSKKRRDLVQRLEHIRKRAAPANNRGMRKWRRELGRGIGRPMRSRAGVLVPKTQQHLLLLRDIDVADVLGARGNTPTLTRLATRPGGIFASIREVTSFPDTGPLKDLSGEFSYPELTLRKYEGQLVLSAGSLVRTQTLVLPESFKWQGRRLHQPKLTQVEGHFGRLRESEQPPQRMEGAFFYFDYAHPGHYGHLMTEAVAKLWGWDEAKAALPELRILLRRHPRDASRSRPRPDLAVLEAFGIEERDVVWVDGPVIVDTLVGATPMWHNNPPFQAHPEMRLVWQRLRDGFRSASPPTSGTDRVFVTRHEGNRLCRNVDQVEAIFVEHGYTLIRPGTLTPAEQFEAFANARVIAGFGGTGMFNMLYADQVRDVIVLNHDSYEARNEHMMSALLEANIHYFWSKADVRPDGSDGYYAAFQSGWEFDVGTHREPLRMLLTELG